jgi:hypothetical protein
MVKEIKRAIIQRAIRNRFPFGLGRAAVRRQAVNQSLWTLGGLGLGVGLMYLLDPDQGHRRRATMREKIARGVRVNTR